jgi:hypothetical protein
MTFGKADVPRPILRPESRRSFTRSSYTRFGPPGVDDSDAMDAFRTGALALNSEA